MAVAAMWCRYSATFSPPSFVDREPSPSTRKLVLALSQNTRLT